jgi:hypothetical protein
VQDSSIREGLGERTEEGLATMREMRELAEGIQQVLAVRAGYENKVL